MIKYNSVNGVNVVKIDFYMFGTIFSQIGGTLSLVYAFFKLIANWSILTGWESSVFVTIFKNKSPSKSQIKTFKERISYKGLYNLHDQLNQLQKEHSSMKEELSQVKQSQQQTTIEANF